MDQFEPVAAGAELLGHELPLGLLSTGNNAEIARFGKRERLLGVI